MNKEFNVTLDRAPTIEQSINKGIHHATLHNALEATTEQINNDIKELMRKSVTDPEIRRIMSQETNQQKLKQRYEHIIEVLDENGSTLIEIRQLAGKTIREVIEDLKNIVIVSLF